MNHIITETKKFYDVPGYIDAVGYEGSDETGSELVAEKGKSYEYSIRVAADGAYQFGVVGSSTQNAKVTLYNGDVKIGEVTLGAQKKTYSLAQTADLKAGKAVLRMEVSGGAASISRLIC